VRAAKGRLFGPEDAIGETSESVVLTDGFWRRRFAADPNIVGQRLPFNGRARVVIGVLPPSFALDGRPIDVATVFAPSIANVENHGQHTLIALGRLKAGVTLAQAQQDLQAVAARLADTYPDIRGWSANVFRFSDELTRTVKGPLLVLMAAAGLVLLIGCINVANLLITRAAARGREVALRQALGASRWRLVSQLLVESTLLALIGGVLGIAVASLGTRLLLRLAPAGQLPTSIPIDARVLGFALAASLATHLASRASPASPWPKNASFQSPPNPEASTRAPSGSSTPGRSSPGAPKRNSFTSRLPRRSPPAGRPPPRSRPRRRRSRARVRRWAP